MSDKSEAVVERCNLNGWAFVIWFALTMLAGVLYGVVLGGGI